MAVCECAHPNDTTPCEGPGDAVRVSDGHGTTMTGCVHHGARILASLTDGTVEPGSAPAAAITVYRAARRLPPMAHHTDDGPGTVAEILAVPHADPQTVERRDRIAAALVVARWRVPDLPAERLLLVGAGRIEATDDDLAAIAEAAHVTPGWLRQGTPADAPPWWPAP